MAQYVWKNAGIRIDGTTGALVDITASVNSQSLQAAITDLEKTGMGSSNRTRENGLANISIPLNGFLNSTTEPIFGKIVQGTSTTKTVEYKVTTNRYYVAEVLPTNIQFSGSPDTLQLFSATLVVSGACNRTSAAAS